VGDAAGLIGGPDGGGVGDGAGGDEIAVVVIAADALVEIKELRGGDDARVERGEAVLDAGIVDGAAGEAGEGVAAVDVDVVIEDVAAGAGPMEDGVVAELRGELRRAELFGVDAASAAGGSGDVGDIGVPADGGLLRVGQGGAGEVGVEELASVRNWVVSRTSGNVALGMMPSRRPG
jgi:hypothetical protein